MRAHLVPSAAVASLAASVFALGAGCSSAPPSGEPAAPAAASWGQAEAELSGDATPRTHLAVNLKRGPARQFDPPARPAPISPYIYGVNGFAAWELTTRWGMVRSGGDNVTDWNWTNNYSNSAADYCFWQGQENGGSKLAGWVTQGSLSIGVAQSKGIAYLVTVPVVDHVSAQYGNNTGINGLCPGTPSCSGGNGYAVNSGNLPFASSGSSPAFVANAAAKPGGNFCTCQPGGSCASGCFVDATGPVYQDELANFLKVTYASGGAPVFFSLDNEPNYWPGTHPEVWPHTGTPGCGTSGTVSFDDIVSRNTTYAAALKNAWPKAKVFGPIVAQDGIVYAGDYSDPHLPTTFADYYLAQMAAASDTAGKPLVDSFDVHYYTSNGSTSQCMQVPRMFWDPSFTTFSPSQTDAIDFQWSGQNNYFDTAMYPRQMVPRLLGKIASAYSGHAQAAPGLSFSEYNPGCETSVEGGVAEADLLGVFGREGVFAATAWPLQGVTSGGSLVNYLVSAFDLYRNYDGAGSTVGDTAVYASAPDAATASAYAFTHSGATGEVEVVAINKTAAAMPVTIAIANAPALTTVAAYELSAAQVGVARAPGKAPSVTCASGTCKVLHSLPARSATTFVLR